MLGDHRAIEHILDRHRPEVVYVTIPDAPQERLDHIAAACRRAGARFTVLRSYSELTPPASSREVVEL